ncbi:mitochondrial import translocase, subunit Tom22 [Sporormia fimetaria CBS 119925]|uniref:Mitochondrial import translocase, subunit Tom22 n=1 Tax=Sporormia fimetaria CBS 119925 TaxID=1340428 RepID=A0A6A6V1F6_9PLEO|nr:mitochondrial import translocase, subunit Tom22 [Sporormia fimetaria CBS 119925]
MVKLEEVVDEDFLKPQEGPIDDDEWDTDSESDASSTYSADEPVSDETLYERLLALQDMLSPHTRRSLSSKYNTASSVLKTGLSWGGKTLWVVSTSMLLIAVPWALAYSEEQMLAEQEREMQMQQRANEFLTAPAGTEPATGAKPAL